MKACRYCCQDKPLKGFRGHRCKDCVAAYWREYRAAKGEAGRERYREWQRSYRRDNPERARATQSRSWLKTMGLTPEEFDAMLAAQGGRCAICRTNRPGGKGRWHIDHDHACCGRSKACKGCIRGLLCLACNVSIGYMAEDPARLIAAADYLIKSKGE